MIEALYVMTVERTRQQRLGDAIRAARKDLGWTQQELADRIESSQSYISLLENGDVDQPGMRLLSRIAVALNIDLNDLLMDSGWPDVSAYVEELQEAQEALAGLSGRRIEIIEMLADMPEDETEKIWSFTAFLREERARYDELEDPCGLDENWRELIRLAPRLPRPPDPEAITLAFEAVSALRDQADSIAPEDRGIVLRAMGKVVVGASRDAPIRVVPRPELRGFFPGSDT